MKRRSSLVFTGVAFIALAVGATYGWRALRGITGQARTTTEVVASPTLGSVAADARATSSHDAEPPGAEPPVAPNDDTLMSELRGVLAIAPDRALALARAQIAAFPQSAHAAERNWVVVRALDDLRRFHEAQDEARAMLARFPSDPWTDDAERHTLVYPLDQPSREAEQR